MKTSLNVKAVRVLTVLWVGLLSNPSFASEQCDQLVPEQKVFEGIGEGTDSSWEWAHYVAVENAANNAIEKCYREYKYCETTSDEPLNHLQEPNSRRQSVSFLTIQTLNVRKFLPNHESNFFYTYRVKATTLGRRPIKMVQPE